MTSIHNIYSAFADIKEFDFSQFVASGCNGMSCAGSIMMCPPPVKTRDHPRPKEEVLSQAKDFIDQYYTVIKRYYFKCGIIIKDNRKLVPDLYY